MCPCSGIVRSAPLSCTVPHGPVETYKRSLGRGGDEKVEARGRKLDENEGGCGRGRGGAARLVGVQ